MSDLWRLSAGTISETIRAGEVSAVDVAKSTLDRLSSVNSRINAVVQEFPDEALASARAVDDLIARGQDPGPLAGVPVTVKVNVDQSGFATTNGVKIQEQLVAQRDNPVVANLRQAGAVIVGRTNTPAFSLRWFTRNRLHGHTKNPHNPKLTPGGSSGGAAAATAAGIGAIGHGTDIAGSIRYPAYACCLHGLRPSLGRVPAVNYSAADRHIGGQLMAVSGPMARTIEDVGLGFEAMARGHVDDPWWTPVPKDLPAQPKRAALALSPSGLKVDSRVQDALRDAGRRLETAGWTVEETDIPDLREPASLQAILWLAEFRRGAAALIEKEGDPDAAFVYQQMVRHCSEPDLNGVLDCLQRRVTLMRDWNVFFERFPIIICPNSSQPPFPDLLDVESPDGFDRVLEAQLPQIAPPFLGLPGLSVATGIGEGNVPMGVQLLSARFREDTLLAAGADIEAAGPALPAIDPRGEH